MTRRVLFPCSTKPEPYFGLLAAVGRDALPVPLDPRGPLLLRLERLPLKRALRVLEKPARPGLAAIVPQRPERPLRARRPCSRAGELPALSRVPGAPLEREILAVPPQGVFLPLELLPVFALQSVGFALAHGSEPLAPGAHEVEVVEPPCGPAGHGARWRCEMPSPAPSAPAPSAPSACFPAPQRPAPCGLRTDPRPQTRAGVGAPGR